MPGYIKTVCCLFVILPYLSTSIAKAAWTKTAIDKPKLFDNFYSRAIAVDSSNNPRVAYGGKNLYYAYSNGTNWVYETIDASNNSLGEYVSIAIDSSDNTHAAYYDRANGNLKYANNTSGSWATYTIDSAGNVGEYTSIAIDKTSDTIHISYYDRTNTQLKYAVGTTPPFSIAVVDTSSNNTGMYSSIALETGDPTNVHISYYDFTNRALMHAFYTGSWGKEEVDGTGDSVGLFSSIDIDTSDVIHISYYDSTNTNPRYAYGTTGSFTKENVDIRNRQGLYSSIVTDTSNVAHITYYDTTNGDLLYSNNSGVGGLWTTPVKIESLGDVGIYTSIAIDNNDKLHVTYFKHSNNKIMYANNTGGSWALKEIDGIAEIGTYSSMVLDSNNTPHISYLGFGPKHISGDGAGGWLTPDFIDRSGSTGSFTSITSDSSNNIHISYFDMRNKNLMYATNSSGAWVTSTADNSGTVEGHTAIAVGLTGNIHIVYFSNGYLSYAVGTPGAFSTEVIDNSGWVGWYPDITLDSNENVYISYSDGTRRMLKYASGTYGSWTTETVDSFLGTGNYSSIALDSNNKAHISYYDYDKQDLKYATNASGLWVTKTVDSDGDVGSYSSIALNSLDHPYISHRDGSNGYLKLTTNTSGAWVSEVIEENGYVGGYTSIAINDDGTTASIHISYYDLENKYLWYAVDSSNTIGPGIVLLPYMTVRDPIAPSDDGEITFAEITEGEVSGELTITLKNEGTKELKIQQIGQNDSLVSPFSLGTTDTCSNKTIITTKSCTFTVLFSPTTAGSSFEDTFDISSDDANSPFTFKLIGSAKAAPNPKTVTTDTVEPFDDLAVIFPEVVPNVPADKDEIVTITNDGDADLIISDINLVEPLAEPFIIVEDLCSSQTIPPKDSCDIIIRFKPTETNDTGLWEDTIIIKTNEKLPADDESGEEYKSLTLTITGTTPVVACDPDCPGNPEDPGGGGGGTCFIRGL